MTPLTTADFEAARAIAAPYIHRTPIIASTSLSELTGARVLLKAESMQRASFDAADQEPKQLRERG